MKTVGQHLKTTKEIGETLNQKQKPVFRSSAIFPVLHTACFSSKVLFLGYWLIKRNLKEIGLLITLRSQKGAVLLRRNIIIDCVKAFSIDLRNLLQDIYDTAHIPTSFYGSIELEVFSTRDMVFPYPAFVITYFNDEFSTSVHTTGRIYNDIEDLQSHDDIKVAESGFDIYPDENLSPFIAFVNGPLKNENPTVQYELINHVGESRTDEFLLSTIQPFETVFLHLNDYFVAGNIQKDTDLISITHTYYDSSNRKTPEDYWQRDQGDHHHSAIMIPLFIKNDHYTNLMFYPIISPGAFHLSFEFYDSAGNLLGKRDNYRYIKTDEIGSGYATIQFGEILSTERWLEDVTSARITTNWENNLLPTRLKMGLNVGITGRKSLLPCNICFAPEIGNPAFDKKPSTFKWSPIINHGNSVIILQNSPTHKTNFGDASVVLKIFREQDQEYIERKILLRPFAQETLEIDKLPDIQAFLDSGSGWITALSNNPYLRSWYFDFHEPGAVAGDHGL